MNLLKKRITYTILIIHFCSGIYAYTMDYMLPFSSSKAAVSFLKDNHLNTKEIITISCDGTSISPYLEKKVFFLCDNNYKSYCNWNSNYSMDITQKNIQTLIVNYMNNRHEAIYVSSYCIINPEKAIHWKTIDNKIKIRFLQKFEKNILENTPYYVFEIVKLNPNPKK